MFPATLLETLADGSAHSPAGLCAALGLGRSELDAAVAELEATGLGFIAATDGRIGLCEAISRVDRKQLLASIDSEVAARIERLETAWAVESTNRLLLEASPPAVGRAGVAIAEYQTGGRGRRGRTWSMPPGTGLALSASWQFDCRPDALGALSLAVGAVTRRAIAAVSGVEAELKWPNDLVIGGGKLGGILVELAELGDGACHVVAGVGINVKAPPGFLDRVSDWQHGARDLAGIAPVAELSRSELAARLIEQLVTLFAGFAGSGFAPYQDEWQQAHTLTGQLVELRTAAGVETGTVCGIGTDGALLLDDARGERRRIISGDVTLRAAG